MLNKFYSFIAAIVFSTVYLNAQTDTETKKILDKLSEKTKSFKSVEVEFTFIVDNKDQKINETTKGTLKMKGEKYRLMMKDQEIICNGQKVYTYNKEANEVQVIGVDELEEDAITPKNMFTIYENNFKSRIKEKKTEDGKNITVIDLYPMNPKEKDYSIVRLFVDTDKNMVTKATVLAKNGTLYTYKIDKMVPDKEMNESLFVFDKTKYPGVTIIE
ncbi:MAG: outer membrane lipoprotein carrier protein LolA [Flavobacteriales bacterium]|nr:outer membrane lipoprotein carrier protein LolA [Flavobacteriales bacterium]